MSKEKSWRAVFALVLAGLCMIPASSALAQPDPPLGRIVWVAVDFPPFQVIDGPNQGSGSFDGLRDLLVREMRDVEHEFVTMTFAQREEAFHEGVLLCSPGMFRTPSRDRYLVFAEPSLIHLDNRLVFLKRNAGRFPSGLAVDLETVLKDRNLVGGVIVSRSFAPNIDALVRRYGGAPNIRMQALSPAQIVELLLKGEIDYTIMFSHEADFLERQAGRSGMLGNKQIVGTPPYIMTQVACTRNDWGEKVVARVNRALRDQRARPEYRQLSERWYVELDRALVRRYYPRLIEAAGDPPR